MTRQVTYLRTEQVPVDKLTPYPGNAKRGDVDAILTSLRSNSQYRSLVVRETGKGRLVVLAGNHTMQALTAHGPGDCGQTVTVGDAQQPCGVCGNRGDWKPAARCEIIACADDAARRINLADNRTADLGEYDDKALLELLTGMNGDYAGTGYDADDLDELLKVTGSLAEETTAFLSAFTTPAEPPTAPAPAAAGVAAAPAAASAGPPDAADPAAPPPQPPAGPVAETAAVPPAVFSASPPQAGTPTPGTTVPVQWVVTIGQRDTIRAAIKHAQTAAGFDTAAEALTDICRKYLTDSET